MGKKVEVKDYGAFTQGGVTIEALNTSIDEEKTNIGRTKSEGTGEGVFEGPIATSVTDGFSKLDNMIKLTDYNFSTIAKYLKQVGVNYQSADKANENIILGLKGDKLQIISAENALAAAAPVSSVTIPDDINQAGYTVTCYGPGGWHLGASATPTSIAGGTNQDAVHKAWVSSGAKYKNGIAVMNVNGQESYLVATAPTFGKVGDSINVKLKNGQQLPCVIADAKSTNDSNYTKYGHGNGSGSVNILEFEVDRNKYKSSGNPSTESWNLEWDSSSPVKTIDNHGSILK